MEHQTLRRRALLLALLATLGLSLSYGLNASRIDLIAWVDALHHTPGLFFFAYSGLMLLSCFGLPLPEEALHASAGVMCALHPAGADTSAWWIFCGATAGFCALNVIAADWIVVRLGRLLPDPAALGQGRPRAARVVGWVRRRGALGPLLFRPLPGARMIGYLACGCLKLPTIEVLIVDALAVTLTVPAQVILIARLGVAL